MSVIWNTMKTVFRNHVRAGGAQLIGGSVRKKHKVYKESLVSKLKCEEFTFVNEPIKSFLKGSKERKDVERKIAEMSVVTRYVPIVIGDKEYHTEETKYQLMPHEHENKIAKFCWATPSLIRKAVFVATQAQADWDRVALNERIKIWRKAADLVATKYRADLVASTMLGQSKTLVQAEIDAACELADFLRFNAYSAKELSKYQPITEKPAEVVNSYRYRGLEGFVAAISPFNFTAIGGNLASAPALMGCGVVWKPSDTAMLSNYILFKILREAGVPPGVINFVPADGPVFGNAICSSPHLAGVNFTGSVPTFNRLKKQVGENIHIYYNDPVMVGELGGKNYHFVHPTADVNNVVMSTIQSAFEYSGQKCSACSRMYIPDSLWEPITFGLIKELKEIKMGTVTNYENFLSAVIDEKAFDRIQGYVENAKAQTQINASILAGGTCDKSEGYFVEPTIIEVKSLNDKLMTEEIFGPVLAVYRYPDDEIWETLQACCDSTQYALTGAIFAKEKKFLECCIESMRETAGNFYVNNKCTGSVVGQQPFGGARKSGTNDKAGGPHYVLRWSSPQSIKEAFVPLKDWRYPYMKS